MCGQTKIDVDVELKKASTLAFSGKRAEARKILREILVLKPSYTDAQTLLARTYAWDRKFDSARIEIKKAFLLSDKNEEATNASIDVELWSYNFQSALELSNKALQEINPRSEEFLFRKARAQAGLGNNKDSYTTLQELLKINPKSEKAIAASETARNEAQLNSLGVTYDYDGFSTTFNPWHAGSAFYSLKTKYLGKVIARINYARRFDITGLQYEVDMYPKITKQMYSYINFGYSNADIFPNYRFGFSLYQPLPHRFEAEIGIRYLKYDASTIIYTGSISKYINNFFVSLRPYFIQGANNQNYQSLSLISRYYLKDPKSYFSLILSTGSDEFARDITLLQSGNLGSSKKIRFGFQHRVLKNYVFSTAVGYGKNEYKQGLFRDNYNFSLGLEMFF